MTKPKTNLCDLTVRSLNKRIHSADMRIYDMRAELARREKITRYGTETPELHEFDVEVEATFYLSVLAKDEADAAAVLDESGWIEWYNTAPGDAVRVNDYDVQPGDPEPALSEKEITDIRADANRRLTDLGLPTLTAH